MSEKHLGYITVRIPVAMVRESESWEMPEEYTYMVPGQPELVSHDIPPFYHQSLLLERDEMPEPEVTLGGWTSEEIAAAFNPPN